MLPRVYTQDYLYLPNSLLTSFANNDGSSSLPYFSNKGPPIPSYLCLCLRIAAPPNNVKNANIAPVCKLTTKLVFKLRPPAKPQRKLMAPYNQLDPFRKSRPFTEATVTTKMNPARLRAITNVFIFDPLLRIIISSGIRLHPNQHAYHHDPAFFTFFQYLNKPSALMPGGLATI